MDRKRFCSYLFVLSLLLFDCAHIFSGDIEKGSKIFKSCIVCHGQNGEGNKEIRAPQIIERQTWYLRNQLLKFKNKERGYGLKDDKEFLKDAVEHEKIHGSTSAYIENDPNSKLMHPLMGLMNEDDIESVIAYLATLKTDKEVEGIKGNARNGKKLYVSCSRCHGKNAEGNKKIGAPKLTNQHGWYLFEQLKDFRMGWRGTHRQDQSGKAMRTHSDNHQNHAVVDIDDESMRDIIAYILSLNSPTAE